MQRYTVKISYEEGRKLGLVLVDTPIPEEVETYESDEEDWSDDGTPINIRGGGAVEIEDDSSDDNAGAGTNEGAVQESQESNANGNRARVIDAEAEAKAKAAAAIATASLRAEMATVAATRVAQGRVPAKWEVLGVGTKMPPPKAIPPPAKPPPPPKAIPPPAKPRPQPQGKDFTTRKSGVSYNDLSHTPQATRVNNKRKRPTRVCVSPNSIVFTLQQRIIELLSSTSPTSNNNIATLLKLGRETNLSVKFRNGVIEMKEINEQVMAFVLGGTIKPGDIVEKIQHTTKASEQMAKVISVRGGSSNSRRKRRSRPYFWSEHYTTFLSENKDVKNVVSLLRSEENYPLYITLKRPAQPDSKAKGSTDTMSPPRKRLKTSTSTVGQPAKNGANDVICLLDSSDEEEEVENKKAEKPDTKGKSNGDTASQPLTARPDPLPLPHYDDDFVLTPYGPGKILSSRVERYASTDKDSEATIYNPTRIYTIDLHFGICHVPASRVKRISGTPYTEKTLITYQRVPITEHDLLRLRPMTYLNDSIINFYLKYLKCNFDKGGGTDNANRGWDDLDGEGIHIFPSFCYTRIKNIMGPSTRNSKAVRTKIWKDLASWTKKVDIFKKKLLCFPINEHLHWTCVFVCHPGRSVRRYAKELHVRKGNPVKVEKSTTNEAPKPAANIPPAPTVSNATTLPTNLAAIPSHMAVKLATGSTIPQPGTKPPSTTDKVSTTTAAAAGNVGMKSSDEKAASLDNIKTKSNESQPTIAPNVVSNMDESEAPGHQMEDKSTSTSDELCGNEKNLFINDCAAVDVAMAMKPIANSSAPQPISNNIDASSDNRGSLPSAGTNAVLGNAEVKSEKERTHNDDSKESKAANENPADVVMTTKTISNSSASPSTSNAVASANNGELAPAAGAAAIESNANVKSENQASNNNQSNESKVANEKQSPSKAKPGTKWQCDYCKEVQFDDFDEAVEHENICTKNFSNTDWCIIHFDSGKHFKLHNTNEITGNIRKYLNAYYEAEYQSTHPGLSSFTMKNMPGFTAAIPQQDNTKDCGVFMLENSERMICNTATMDKEWVKRKGVNDKRVFGTHTYDKQVIEKKRDDLLQLVQTLRRGKNEID